MPGGLREDAAISDYEGVSEVFRCLSAPMRVAIIDHLSGGPACVHELVETFEAPQPLVSQHLRILRAANLVTRARRGREVAYTLSDDHVAHIVRDALRHSTEALTGEEASDDDAADHLDHVG